MLRVRSYGRSDRGRVREHNEDHFLIADLQRVLRVVQSSLPQPETRVSDERCQILLVADGMGGHRAGAEASTLALRTIEDFVLNALRGFSSMDGAPRGSALSVGDGRTGADDQVLAAFQAALREADARIFARGAADPALRGMGTTLTLACCLEAQLFVVHVGDSRCYLWRGGQLYRLTHDHTLVEEMVRRGALTKELAATHRLRHVITNAVGGTEPGLTVEAHRLDLSAGDGVLLCSDGLTEMLGDERIGAILAAEDDPRAACERLVDEANAAGGRDNVTVVVARFGEDQAAALSTLPTQPEGVPALP